MRHMYCPVWFATPPTASQIDALRIALAHAARASWHLSPRIDLVAPWGVLIALDASEGVPDSTNRRRATLTIKHLLHDPSFDTTLLIGKPRLFV